MKKLFKRIVILISFLEIFGLAFADSATTGGNNNSAVTTPPNQTVANFYNLALAGAGLLAFGFIVWGAIKYTLSAGNPGQQSDARDTVLQALLGLLLLVGAYLILNTINPNLTSLRLPELQPIQSK